MIMRSDVTSRNAVKVYVIAFRRMTSQDSYTFQGQTRKPPTIRLHEVIISASRQVI